MQDGSAFIIDDHKLSFDGLSTKGVPATEPALILPPEAPGRHLGRLLHRLETTGTFIACAASVINHAYRFPHKSLRLLQDLRVWLPPTMSAPGDNARTSDQAVPLEILNRLHSLTLRLDVARDLTLRQCAAAEASAPLDPVAVEELAGFWGIICEGTMELLQDMRSSPLLEQPSRDLSSIAPSAERLLAAAALGASPCVSVHGAIQIPGWIERRSERRHRLRLPCELRIPGRVWQLRTVDISRHGAGIAGSPALDAGCRATLVIAGTSEIGGVLVWRTADRLGFRFDQPLSIADLGGELARD